MDMHKTKILIVEDESIVALDMKNTLTNFGYEVTNCVTNYNDAVNSVHANKPELILMDINLGTGNGYSVLEVVKSYEKASGKNIPYKIQSRRVGDIASCYADAKKAQELLEWSATKNIDDMCNDAWNWQFNK